MIVLENVQDASKKEINSKNVLLNMKIYYLGMIKVYNRGIFTIGYPLVHSDYSVYFLFSLFSICGLKKKIFFPDIIEPIIIESVEVQDYCDTYIHPTLLKALFKIVDEKPEDPLLFLAEWLLRNNPFQPHYLDSLVALAPT